MDPEKTLMVRIIKFYYAYLFIQQTISYKYHPFIKSTDLIPFSWSNPLVKQRILRPFKQAVSTNPNIVYRALAQLSFPVCFYGFQKPRTRLYGVFNANNEPSISIKGLQAADRPFPVSGTCYTWYELLTFKAEFPKI